MKPAKVEGQTHLRNQERALNVEVEAVSLETMAFERSVQNAKALEHK